MEIRMLASEAPSLVACYDVLVANEYDDDQFRNWFLGQLKLNVGIFTDKVKLDDFTIIDEDGVEMEAGEYLFHYID